MTEYELIKKLINQDQSAFREFVDRSKNKVVNLCFGFVHNRETAEDLAQEIFLEVFLSVKHFKQGSSLNTWLYRIAVNKSLDYLRKINRKKRAAKLLSIFGLTTSEEAQLQESATPFSAFAESEVRLSLMRAIDKLPENQKAAITLNKFEDLSYKEIADILGTTVSAVDSLISRAKKNMKKFLQGEGFS